MRNLQTLSEAFWGAPWLLQPDIGDVAAALSVALGAGWTVVRETDCEGDVSIVALPGGDPDNATSFILFERDGSVFLAAVSNDHWAWERRYTGFRAAMDALVAAARGRR